MGIRVCGWPLHHEEVQFADLNDAESALWRGFAYGTAVDLQSGEPVVDDPRDGAGWEPERVVRAEVIAALMLGAQPAEPGHIPAVSLRGARIAGRLALSFADVLTTLSLQDCYFEEAPDFYWAALGFTSLRGSVLPAFIGSNLHVRGHLRLTGCAFGGEVRLRGARIDGALLMEGARIRSTGGALDCQRLQVAGDIQMREGFAAHGEVRMFNARVGGSLSITAATLSAPGGLALSADNIHVDGSLYAQQARITGEVQLRHAVLSGGLFMRAAQLSNPDGVALLGNRLDSEGIYLDDLTCEGEIKMAHARIGRNFVLAGADLRGGEQAITAEGAVIQGPVNAHRLRAAGTVNLTDAQVTGPIHFEGARLDAGDGIALAANGLRADAILNLCDGFTAHGTVSLTSARIGSSLCLDDAALLTPGAEALRCWRTATPELVLRPREPVQGTVSLNHATVAILRDDPSAWPVALQLDGLTYGILDPQLPARDRLAWISRDPRGYLASPYEQLAACYRNHGYDTDARTVQLTKQHHRLPGLPWYARAWGHIQNVTVGYGYRPARAALWLLTLLAIGTTVFAIHPPSPFPGTSAPPFSPLIYTLNLILPVIDFGQARSFDPRGIEQWLSYALIAAGWILATAAATGLVRVLRRD